MKRTIKITGIILMAVMLLALLTTVSNASDGLDPAGMANNLKGTTSNAQTDVMNIGNQIIGIITTVGVVVAVVILLVLGIKYMMGSASEKAEYKKTMIPYLVGAILIFGASAITKVVVSLASGIGG
jgi:type IV secretory pathway VirB2 component (pilin)